jgi:predicted DCC family thiol-disulfide oxidoreductase YuxK
MNPSTFIDAVGRFFFLPERPTPLALYRIFFGILVAAKLMFLYPDWLTWFGTQGILTLSTVQHVEHGPRLSLFSLLPAWDAITSLLFWILLVFAGFVTVGFQTRVSSFIVFWGLASLDQRNPMILNGGDLLLRIMAFFLVFAPSGSALSLDRIIRIYRGKELAQPHSVEPWAQRMMQLQVALMYAGTVVWKMAGETWLSGTAVYYILHLAQFRRFPVPAADNLWFSRFGSWGTLAIESAAGTLIWFREFRYYVLLGLLMLHGFIEYALTLQLFQWIVMTTFILFVYPQDLTRAWNWLLSHMARDRSVVLYDGNDLRCRHCAEALRALDVLQRLCLIDASQNEPGAAVLDTTSQDTKGHLLIHWQGNWCSGIKAVAAISWAVPLLWPLAPLRIAYRRSAKTAPAVLLQK